MKIQICPSVLVIASPSPNKLKFTNIDDHVQQLKIFPLVLEFLRVFNAPISLGLHYFFLKKFWVVKMLMRSRLYFIKLLAITQDHRK